MVDLDPQGNATMGSGVDKRKLEADRVRRAAGIGLGGRSARQRSEKCGYDVLGANRELAGAEVELVDVERREKRLQAGAGSRRRRVRLRPDRLPAVAVHAHAQRPVRGARRDRADAVRVLRARRA